MSPIRDDLPRLKRVLFWTTAFSLAAHAYIYFNLLPSHDSMSMFFTVATSGEVSLGRFLLPVYRIARGVYPAPWVIGMLSIVFLALSSYFIFAVLGIKNRFSIALLCGIFSTHITITATNATYMYASDSYLLALLFACAGAYLWERLPKWGLLLAVPLFAASMGLYSAYIDVAIGLALLLLIRRVMDGEPFSVLWRRAVGYALSLTAGGILYFGLVELTEALFHAPMSAGYNGMSNLLESDPFSLLKFVPMAYAEFVGFFIGTRSYVSPLFRICSVLLALTGVPLWISRIRHRHIRGLELAMLLLCAALLPLGLDFVYILSSGVIHELMIFSYVLIYTLCLLPWESFESTPPASRRAAQTVTACLCIWTILHGIVFANGAYYKKQLLYDVSSQAAYSIAEELARSPDYEPGVTPVALIGDFSASSFARITDDFPQYRSMTGMSANTSFTYSSTFCGYFYYYLGQPILRASGDQMAEISSRRAVQLMPPYPQDGYCQMIDGVMVVKLSG